MSSLTNLNAVGKAAGVSNDEQIFQVFTERQGERTERITRHPRPWSEEDLCDLWRYLATLLLPFDASDGGVTFRFTPIFGVRDQNELLVTIGDQLTARTSPLSVKLSVVRAAHRRLHLSMTPPAGHA